MNEAEIKIREIYSPFLGKFFLQNEILEEYSMFEGSILEINSDEYKKLIELNELLHEYLLIQRKVKEVELNFNDYFETVMSYERKLSTCELKDSESLRLLAFIDINRCLTNFLTSFNSLIYDFLNKYMIPHLFGKNSMKSIEFNKKTNDWFDNNFYYKFLICLRDYAIHRNLPIHIVNFDIQFDEMKNPQIEIKISICFRKSTLLKNSAFKKKIKRELDMYAEEFPVYPFLENIKIFLDKFERDFILFCDNLFIDMASSFMDFYNTFSNPDLVSFGKITENGEISLIHFHIETIKQILEFEK
ncbi:MAG: hypothetical protein ACM3PT_02570 [Deltaproteobacteria bacterium]